MAKLAPPPSAGWPPRYGPPHENQGPLRRFSALTWARTLFPGFAQQFDGEVPSEFWTEDLSEDGTSVAVIACPCGATPGVLQNATAICEGEGCGRVFMRIADRIQVARYEPEDLAPEAE